MEESTLYSLFTNRLTQNIQELEKAHQECAIGNYQGAEKKVRSIRKDPICNYSRTYHEIYSCMPLDSAIPTYIELVKKTQVQNGKNLLTSSNFLNLAHLLLSHLYSPLDNVTTFIIQAGNDQSNSRNHALILYFCLSLIINIIILIFSIIAINLRRSNVATANNFIIRLPPYGAVESASLLNYIMNRKVKKQAQNSSPIANIINESNLPIVYANSLDVIESVNSSFIIVFGYDASQIVGQNINLIFKDEEFSKMLKENESKKRIVSFTAETICTKENENTAICNVTVIPIFDKSRELQFNAFLINDIEAQKQIQQKANDLKVHNDTLESTIYPSIYFQNQSQEKNDQHTQSKEPSLNENQSSIIQIDNCVICCIKLLIQNASLSPSTIIQQRDGIFGKFEEILKEHDCLQELHISNGCFIAIGIGNLESVCAEALSFAFQAFVAYDDPTFFGEFAIGLDCGGPLRLFLTKGNNPKPVAIGNVLKTAEALMKFGTGGIICLSSNFFEKVKDSSTTFIEQSNPMFGKYYTTGKSQEQSHD